MCPESGSAPRHFFLLTWIAALAVATATQLITFRLPSPAGAPVRANARDALLAIVAAAPWFIYLIATWRQEFPYLGDQWLHNACAIEAYQFWWPWGWITAVVATAFVVWQSGVTKIRPFALIGLGCRRRVRLACRSRSRSPGAIPERCIFSRCRAGLMHTTSPLNVERLLNALSIPGGCSSYVR